MCCLMCGESTIDMVVSSLCERREGIATLKLARLYRSRGNHVLAAAWYKDHVTQQEQLNSVRTLCSVVDERGLHVTTV